MGILGRIQERQTGFYLATLDAAAPSLLDYLGDVGRTGIESMLTQGDVVALDGVQKNVIDCNWKIAIDNLFDWYHVRISHSSASRVGYQRLMMPIPLPLAEGLDRLLGQPQHQAYRAGRHRTVSPAAAPRSDLR